MGLRDGELLDTGSGAGGDLRGGNGGLVSFPALMGLSWIILNSEFYSWVIAKYIQSESPRISSCPPLASSIFYIYDNEITAAPLASFLFGSLGEAYKYIFFFL